MNSSATFSCTLCFNLSPFSRSLCTGTLFFTLLQADSQSWPDTSHSWKFATVALNLDNASWAKYMNNTDLSPDLIVCYNVPVLFVLVFRGLFRLLTTVAKCQLWEVLCPFTFSASVFVSTDSKLTTGNTETTVDILVETPIQPKMIIEAVRPLSSVQDMACWRRRPNWLQWCHLVSKRQNTVFVFFFKGINTSLNTRKEKAPPQK